MNIMIDFYKKFKLPHPHVGLVSKVTSPKGIRRQESTTYTSYHLHSTLCNIYNGDACLVEPGIYWVLDISNKNEDRDLRWYHYLFIVENEEIVYPVGEFLNQLDSEWITTAIPHVIKPYFHNQKLSEIKLTKIKQAENVITGWNFKKK